MLTTYRHFCSSSHLLDGYCQSGKLEEKHTCKLIKQAIQLSLRSEATYIPDHLHRQRIDFIYDEKKTLAEMLLYSLGAEDQEESKNLNSEILKVYNNALYVDSESFEVWQHEILSHSSPLPFLAAAWEKHGYKNKYELSLTFKNIYKTLDCSSLPSILDKRLDRLIQSENKEQGNLVDLHMHFNGTTEFSEVWLHTLQHKLVCYKELQQAYSKDGENGKVGSFYKQLQTTPRKVYLLLCKADLLRQLIVHMITLYDCKIKTGSTPKKRESVDIKKALKFVFSENVPNNNTLFYGFSQVKHPFNIEKLSNKASDLQKEGAMFVYALRIVRKTKNYHLSLLLHLYILFMNQYLRLLVQQKEQFGFDQFQYITLLGAREALEEKDTKNRFRQLKGMYGVDVAHIEARFAPKDSVEKNVKLIQKIWKGYIDTCRPKTKLSPLLFPKHIVEKYGNINNPDQCYFSKMELGLVAHFIKETEKGYSLYRHIRLRHSLFQKASALLEARKELNSLKDKELYNVIVGKDAASNELETPPEVFAPVFRYLHHHGITSTTYHAGEDFDHVLSGIRAVHEAITFLDMSNGDRIGHATALGIEPHICDTMPMYCAQGAWLDNLVWLTKMISENEDLLSYNSWIASLFPHIQTLYRNIFNGECPELSVLWEAWKMRKIDISLINYPMEPLIAYKRFEFELIKKAKKNAKAFEELRKYHLAKYRKAWDKKICLSNFPQIDINLLKKLQDCIIIEMRKKNILIEVLPTSNVRISHYDGTSDHHIVRWLSKDERPAPQIVLGTDDPGIFSTNLRNEYSLILKLLQQEYSSSSEKPYEIIRHLIENGHSYKFALGNSLTRNSY